MQYHSDPMVPVVLSGGSGTRLWPVSRAAFPKQFNELLGESLLSRTLRRLVPLGAPRLIAGSGGEAATRRVLAEVGLPDERAVFEPVGRNTGPAVALACHLLLESGREDEVAGSFHADHLIADEDTFLRAVRLAESCARSGQVATLGIRPTAPDTGMGYIEIDPEVFAREDGPAAGAEGREPLTAHRVRGFREKPDAETARRFVDSGDYLWNAGMFVFRVDVMAGHFERLLPDLWGAIRSVAPDLGNLAEVYERIAPISIDHGIMERLDEQVTIPCEMGWSDVGSWDEVARLGPRGASVFEQAAEDNFVFPLRERVYGLVGVEGLIVVDTDDALLIARRGSTQEVKVLVERLRAAGRREATEHSFEIRPWGDFEVLRDTEGFKSKVIRVTPGHRLSYQSHRHRSEHWIVVRGRPEVTLDGTVHRLGPGEHIHIPQGARHRIANPGDELVELIEIQLGTYFGEDDIERYEDDYERA